jgi:hypothetical protein
MDRLQWADQHVHKVDRLHHGSDDTEWHMGSDMAKFSIDPSVDLVKAWATCVDLTASTKPAASAHAAATTATAPTEDSKAGTKTPSVLVDVTYLLIVSPSLEVCSLNDLSVVILYSLSLRCIYDRLILNFH